MLFFKRSDVLNIFSPIACILATKDGALIPVNVGNNPNPPLSMERNCSRSESSETFRINLPLSPQNLHHLLELNTIVGHQHKFYLVHQVVIVDLPAVLSSS